jgi:hypothetical protein
VRTRAEEMPASGRAGSSRREPRCRRGAGGPSSRIRSAGTSRECGASPSEAAGARGESRGGGHGVLPSRREPGAAPACRAGARATTSARTGSIRSSPRRVPTTDAPEPDTFPDFWRRFGIGYSVLGTGYSGMRGEGRCWGRAASLDRVPMSRGGEELGSRGNGETKRFGGAGVEVVLVAWEGGPVGGSADESMKGRDDGIETWGGRETALRGEVGVWKCSPEPRHSVPRPFSRGRRTGRGDGEPAGRRGWWCWG